MPVINGIKINKLELLKRVGSIEQVCGFKKYIFNEGKAQGVEAVDINNGNGLMFTILLGRNLDIANCIYKGINVSYITKNGIVSSCYFEKDGNEWFRNFIGGLLTTCGITYAGAPCYDNGKQLGLHGRISNCPAENICCESYWKDDDYIISIKGKTYERKFFGDYICLSREIKVVCGENKIYIHDSIENLGYEISPIMMIYHFNFGYPLLDTQSEVYIDSYETIPVDYEAQKNFNERFKITEPMHKISENVYFHKMNSKENICSAVLFNEKLGNNGIGVKIRFNKDELPYLNQWKMMGEGEYVLGLEPSNCMTLGRKHAKENGMLRYINPGEIKHFNIEVEIIEDRNSIL